ncbi:hypothetical protein Droror1_Dr00022185 [Drosera rotundifolia]
MDQTPLPRAANPSFPFPLPLCAAITFPHQKPPQPSHATTTIIPHLRSSLVQTTLAQPRFSSSRCRDWALVVLLLVAGAGIPNLPPPNFSLNRNTHKNNPKTSSSLCNPQNPLFSIPIPNLEFAMNRKDVDLEARGGSQALYPMMLEPPELRWAFIRKIYIIVAIQLIATIAVAATVVTFHPIARFFVSTPAGVVVYIVIAITPFIVLCPLYFYHQKHPVNFFLLGIFTISLAFTVGLSCAFTSGRIILEAVILTAVVVVSLTLYTFWAARRGHDFSFLGPFLFGALLVLIVFGLIQAFFPLGKFSVMVFGLLASIIFCGYIVYDTDNLIKRYSYDEYIWAAVALYLDIINLFLVLLTVLQEADN